MLAVPLFSLLVAVGTLLTAAAHGLGFGGERTYLVLLQDTNEIRPTGGFIGNYGIVRLRDGRPLELKFGDVYDLDRPYFEGGASERPVGMVLRYFPEAGWSGLRDANLWPDFPTSARRAAAMAEIEGGADQVDGVVAITNEFARRVMRAIGPVTVPGLDAPVTADNFEETIRYFQSGPGIAELGPRFGAVYPEGRKVFVRLLISSVIGRAGHPTAWPGLAAAAFQGLRAKEVLLWSRDPALEAATTDAGVAGEMLPTDGDYLWVVDSNVSSSKDNGFVDETIAYRVDVTGERPTAELTLHYDYTRTGDRFLGFIQRDFYGDYIRVYAPSGATLVAGEGADEQFESWTESGKTRFSALLKMIPGSQRTVRLRYALPPLSDGGYRLTLQKEPGQRLTGVTVDVVQRGGERRLYAGTLERDVTLTAGR